MRTLLIETREMTSQDLPAVDLVNAMICYTPGFNSQAMNYNRPAAGRAFVFNHGREKSSDERFHRSVGAVFKDWGEMSPDDRLSQFLADIWHAVVCDAVDPLEMHNACMRIREYRELLAPDYYGRMIAVGMAIE